ncbi:ABC transporter ATP-binding protein [Georgenia ruanii]
MRVRAPSRPDLSGPPSASPGSSPAPAAPALAVRGLRKSYGGREVVRGLSLTAERGRLTAVLGPNGAGKTTTIECCEGLRRPDAGTIEVLGRDRAARGSDAPLRERVGVMLQDGGLPMAPKAGAVLAHLARLHADPLDPAALLERLGLAEVARTSVRRLSGGQRQRLALAGAIVGRPELVFLDEPSAGLDPQSRLAVWDLLRELRAGGTSLVLTTHLMTEAEELADHVVIIDRGQVIAEGTPAQLTDGVRVRIGLDGAPAAEVAGLAAALSAALARAERADLGVHAVADAVEVTPDGDVDAGTLAAVSTAVAEAGHPGAHVAVHRRTLEDTFLDLTGRALREGTSA